MSIETLALSQDLAVNLENPPTKLEAAISQAKMMVDQVVHTLTEAMIHQNDHILNEWSYEAKGFIVLLRDICFQLYKVKALNIPEDAAANHQEKMGRLLREAQNDLYLKLGESLTKNERPDNWKHYNSPTPTVITQIEDLVEQMDSLPKTIEYLSGVSSRMDTAKENITHLLTQYTAEVNIIAKSFNHIKSKYVEGQKFLLKDNLPYFRRSLEKNYNQIQDLAIEKPKPKLADFTPTKQKIPIQLQNGNLIFKEIDILKEMQSWKDKIIYPAIIECEKYLEILHEKTSRLLLNTNNRIELFMSENQDDISTAELNIKGTWENITEEIKYLTGEFEEVKSFVLDKIESLSITDIFKSDRFFLERISDEYDDDDFSEENFSDLEIVKKTKGLLEKLRKRAFKSGIIKNPGLTEIIQFVKDKSIFEIDRVTYSLFLNRGFLGISFVVKRNIIIDNIVEDIVNWVDGFRGSILLFGKRLSGKSTIIESLGYYLPQYTTIILEPFKQIEFKSRKFSTETDLGAALEFILKNSISDRIIVCIDDLEMWRNAEGHLYHNILTFLDYQNKYSKRLFFIVNTNHWFKRQLDIHFNFSSKFTSTINTDEMTLNNIKKAIALRHGASLKDAVYHDHLTTENKEIKVDQLAKKVAIASHQVIGASLIEWAHVYHIGNINNARFQRNLPQDMIRVIADRWTIFHYILKYKITSEKELIRALGPTFLKEIGPDIQFLISCKILQRDSRNNLLVNEYIIDEIESHFLKVKHL